MHIRIRRAARMAICVRVCGHLHIRMCRAARMAKVGLEVLAAVAGEGAPVLAAIMRSCMAPDPSARPSAGGVVRRVRSAQVAAGARKCVWGVGGWLWGG